MKVKINSVALDEVRYFLTSLTPTDLGEYHSGKYKRAGALAARKKAVDAIKEANKEMTRQWEKFYELQKKYGDDIQEFGKQCAEKLSAVKEDEREVLSADLEKDKAEYAAEIDKKFQAELEADNIKIGSVARVRHGEEPKRDEQGRVSNFDTRVVLSHEEDLEVEIDDKLAQFVADQLLKNCEKFWFEDKLFEAAEAFGADVNSLVE